MLRSERKELWTVTSEHSHTDYLENFNKRDWLAAFSVSWADKMLSELFRISSLSSLTLTKFSTLETKLASSSETKPEVSLSLLGVELLCISIPSRRVRNKVVNDVTSKFGLFSTLEGVQCVPKNFPPTAFSLIAKGAKEMGVRNSKPSFNSLDWLVVFSAVVRTGNNFSSLLTKTLLKSEPTIRSDYCWRLSGSRKHSTDLSAVFSICSGYIGDSDSILQTSHVHSSTLLRNESP